MKICQLIATHGLPALRRIDQSSEGRIFKPQHELIKNAGYPLLLKQLGQVAIEYAGSRRLIRWIRLHMRQRTIEIRPQAL